MLNLRCIIDGNPIPEDRENKAITCSQDCAEELGRRKRNKKAEGACRLCGRKFRKQRVLEPVLTQHSGFNNVGRFV